MEFVCCVVMLCETRGTGGVLYKKRIKFGGYIFQKKTLNNGTLR